MSLHGDPTFALHPDDPNIAVCLRCGAHMSSEKNVNFRNFHRNSDCPKRPNAGAVFHHASFPEFPRREGELFWVRDPKNPGVYPQVPFTEVLQHTSTKINNDATFTIRDNKKLRTFFLRLARDIGGLATLYTHPDKCSPATIGNLEHFRRRADGNDEGW